MTDLLSELEAVPVVAYAWRKEGMNGWALGHNPPTPNMIDFDKYEVRELTFRTHHAEIAAAVRDAKVLREQLRKVTAVAVTQLFDRYREDVTREFSMAELCAFVKLTEPLKHSGARVEHVYRDAWDTAMRAGEGEG